MVIGLTGGIGCGKSTAARLFEELGYRLLDSDKIVHELLASDESVIKRIVERFGSDMRLGEGGIDRKALGAIVFSDSEALEDLEAILHPETGKRWQTEVEAQASLNWVVEIPLLFEKNLQNRFDLTVCVFSDQRNQLERLSRKGLDRQQSLARIAKQLPLKDKAEKADYTLLNDGTIDFLRVQIQTLVNEINNNPL
ncbi:dephospho-CoA kinase [Puniceicoccaceae bacterium K14]|nr:dephospho-CoA kinase [Puniceicoccaceae bacterium K14]